MSLRKIFPDTQRKHLLRIFFEAIHCLFLEKELPFYYFENLLYKKDSPSYYNFIGSKKRGKIINNFYFRNGVNENLENKVKFSKILSENNIRSPKKIAYSDGLIIVTESKTIKVTNVDVLREILKELIDVSKDKSIFIKKIEGLGGFHTFKFDSKEKPSMVCFAIEKYIVLQRKVHNVATQ